MENYQKGTPEIINRCIKTVGLDLKSSSVFIRSSNTARIFFYPGHAFLFQLEKNTRKQTKEAPFKENPVSKTKATAIPLALVA